MVHPGTALMQARPTGDLRGRPGPESLPARRTAAPGTATQAQRASRQAARSRTEKLARELLNPE
ncbi:hypothetical protein GCM10009125_12910 [Castellaniella daejeonensis]|uniref:Uncharacterized protein n=1 Tax=Castellaniella daejeonensis TaxID=659013 RepID=A0ABN0TMC1_9BURK